MLCCFATACIRCTIGPSSGSAVSYHLGSCSAQKYGPWKPRRLPERRDDVASEVLDHPLGTRVLLHRVDVELGHPDGLELLELGDALVGRAEDAEPVHHVVGDE